MLEAVDRREAGRSFTNLASFWVGQMEKHCFGVDHWKDKGTWKLFVPSASQWTPVVFAIRNNRLQHDLQQDMAFYQDKADRLQAEEWRNPWEEGRELREWGGAQTQAWKGKL